jgi:hypothetical protein
VTAIASIHVAGVAKAEPVAAAPNCNGSYEDTVQQSGNRRQASGQIGVYALVEVFNPALCVQPPADDSGSSVSVSLRGGIAELFAVGYVKCASTPFCGPYNGGVPYYFYWYSRAGGACGNVFSTGVVKAPKGNVGSTPSYHDFEARAGPMAITTPSLTR